MTNREQSLVASGDRQLARLATEQAWQRFVEAGGEPADVRPEIGRSWQRCHAVHRVDPLLAAPSRLLSPEQLEERRRADEGLRLSIPILQELAGQLSDHVLAFFDKDGWMLAIDGDPATIERLRAIEFRPGANWSERDAGTNGPGTCLAEGAPVEVDGAEHYVAAWQPWSCAAAPVILPGGSAVLGAVDLTGPWELRSRRSLSLSRAVAFAIRERLNAAARVREEVVRYALRSAREGGDALLAVDGSGKVVGLNDAASRLKLVGAGGLAPAVRAAVRAAEASPDLAADGEARIVLPDTPPLLVSLVKYQGAAVGAIVRGVAAAHAPSPRTARARHRPSSRYDFDCILGTSDGIRRVVALARTASRNDLPVVITGESGTGKEVVAQSLHAASSRSAGPFVVVNCGAIPEALVQAELFGYEPGTFTGAVPVGSAGRFEDADGGTLLLDEISELPQQAQIALLRLLQEKEVVRLGGSAPRRLDVRVVAATNRPLDAEVRAGRFRSDLYYRLSVLPIVLPPLRERGEDVELLARAFAAEAALEVGREQLALSADALLALRRYHWPGNVRELRNVILRAAATAPEPLVRAADLAFDCPEPAGAKPAAGTLREAVLDGERAKLVEAMEACGWNLAAAAQRLGISRTTLYRLMHKCGIERPAGG